LGDTFNTSIWQPSGGNKQKSWYSMTPYERESQVYNLEQKVSEYPDIPPEEKAKPLMRMLQFIGGIINIPSSAISGLAYQLLDKKPGIGAKEYLKFVFGHDGFQEQGTWSDVISMLAKQNPEHNIWDSKVAQTVVGLIMDMVLDPLNFFGAGLAKQALHPDDVLKLSKTARKLYLESVAKMGGKAEAGKYADRIAKEIAKMAAGQTWGIKLPFSSKVAIPLINKPRKYIDELLRVGATPLGAAGMAKTPTFTVDMMLEAKKRTGALRFVNPAESRTRIGYLIDDFVSKIKGLKGIYNWGKKAFLPGTTAYEEVLQAGIKRQSQIMANSQDLQEALKLVSKYPRRTQVLMRRYLENVGNVIYKDSKAVYAMAEKAKLMTELVKRMTKNDISSKRFFKELYKANKEYRGIITDEIKHVIKSYIKKGEKFTPDVAERVLKEATDIYDTSSVRQLQALLHDMGFEYDGNLLKYAGYKPDTYKFTEVPKWKDAFSKMTQEQKDILNTSVDRVRILHDKWFEEELQNGIPLKYVRNYMSGYRGVWKGTEAPLEAGAEKQWFQFTRTMNNTDDILNSRAADMVRQGVVEPKIKIGMTKAEERLAYKKAFEKAKAILTSPEGHPEYGKIMDTITEATYYRGVGHYKAMARKAFVDEVRQYGIKAGEATDIAGMKSLGDKIPELAGYLFTNRDAEYIGRAIDVLSSEEGISKFLKAIDKVTDWWKVLATSVNPGFHFRNMYSNHFLGWTWLGMSYFNPKTHKIASHVARKYLYGKDNVLKRAMGDTISDDKVMNQVWAHGMTVGELADAVRGSVLRKEYRIAELSRQEGINLVANKGKKILKRINPASKDSLMATIGEKLGSIVESEARFAAFLTRFKQTGSVERALRETQNVFVNYQRITPFEQKIMRKVVPFWTWMSRNVANQLKFVFTQPGRYSKVAKLAAAVGGGIDTKVPDELQPTYFKDLWMWQLPITLPNGTPLFFNPNLPFQDLNKLPIDLRHPKEAMDTFVRNALSSISPFLKFPIEVVGGYDIFRGRPLERYPGYKAPVPGIFQYIAKQWLDAFPDTAEKLGMDVESNGMVTMNPRAARAIENFLPFVNNYARMLAQTPNKENYDNIFQSISYLVGIKVKPLDLLKQRNYYLLNELKQRKEYWKEHQNVSIW